MKKILILSMMSCLPLAAVELDTAAVGHDLNGWNENKVAWFGTDGLRFCATQPVVHSLEEGTVEITMRLEQVAKRVSVYKAELRMVVTRDGLVRAASVVGEVDGAPFSSGEVTRPESAVVANGEEGEAMDLTPVNAEKEMQQELSQLLDSAIEKARSDGASVRRDMAARFFGSDAGESASLSKATDLVFRSLFRRVGP
jgi:hypothetical protein